MLFMVLSMAPASVLLPVAEPFRGGVGWREGGMGGAVGVWSSRVPALRTPSAGQEEQESGPLRVTREALYQHRHAA